MLRVIDLGQIDFDSAFALQERLLAERDAEIIPDTLLLLEHPPTITIGRRGSEADVWASPAALESADIVIRSTNRGGLVTYHGPGQVVGYLISRLASFAGSAPALVHGLEDGIIKTLAQFGIEAFRYPHHRGVFAEAGKIAAVGLGVRRGITMHGFALNREPNLGHFALINPCGLADLGVTSMERLLGASPDGRVVNDALAFHMGAVFNREIIHTNALSGALPQASQSRIP
jgi:lipoyl(octanoyl) transferase